MAEKAPFKLPLRKVTDNSGDHNIVDADDRLIAFGLEEDRRDYIIAAVNEREGLVRERDELRKHIAILITETQRLQRELGGERGVLTMTVDRLGGNVEGRPTERVNFLQRIDELREIERERDALCQWVKELREHLRLHCDGNCGRAAREDGKETR